MLYIYSMRLRILESSGINWHVVKYASVLSIPVTVIISFQSTGWLTYIPLVYVFGLIPLLELFFPPHHENLEEEYLQKIKHDPLYDWILYLMVPLQWGALCYFLMSIMDPPDVPTLIGRITAMGIMCGVFGINVAHELGHRKTWYEQLLSKILLLSSLYMHFFIEHNRGHHKRVSTPEDPGSARMGESLYRFWGRSLVHSYLSAWKLESDRLQKLGCPTLSWKNEMIWFQLIQLALLASIWWFGGWKALGAFSASAVIGILLLETVNYIEHYGLSRKSIGDGHYERVRPWHSWNSDHLLGRIMLFELSRHSDHHYKASKKYQLLSHHQDSPQMPTGYPGMMLVALLPPLWYRLMNPLVEDISYP